MTYCNLLCCFLSYPFYHGIWWSPRNINHFCTFFVSLSLRQQLWISERLWICHISLFLLPKTVKCFPCVALNYFLHDTRLLWKKNYQQDQWFLWLDWMCVPASYWNSLIEKVLFLARLTKVELSLCSHELSVICCYCPQTKFGAINVFTPVCDSVHWVGGLSHCMLGYTNAPRQTPP